MNSKIRTHDLWNVATVLLWLFCIACDGDTSTTPNRSQSAMEIADTEIEKPETFSSKVPVTLPSTPISRYQGLRDPFSPLITLEKEQALMIPSVQPVKRNPQTTLEMIALGQLTLTAVFKGPEGRKALVEEVGGKGHIIEKGAFIGTRGGRVEAITVDGVIIVEKTIGTNGKVTIHKRELKLASRSNDPS